MYENILEEKKSFKIKKWGKHLPVKTEEELDFLFLTETNFKRQNMWNTVLKTLEVRQQSRAIQTEKKQIKQTLQFSHSIALSFQAIARKEKTQEDVRSVLKLKRSWKLKKAEIARVHRQSTREILSSQARAENLIILGVLDRVLREVLSQEWERVQD